MNQAEVTRPIEVPTVEDRIEYARSRVPILSESERAALSSFDQMATNTLEAGTVMDVVGVVAGVKPAALLYDGLEDLDILKNVGLYVSLIDGETPMYAISRDLTLAEELQGLMMNQSQGESEDFAEKHARIGRLLGYPTTGTDYFVRRFQTMNSENLPMIRLKQSKGTVDASFQQLILSPEHYKDEVRQYSEPLQAAVKELAPHSYAIFESAARKERIARKMNRFLKFLPGVKSMDDSYPVRYVE